MRLYRLAEKSIRDQITALHRPVKAARSSSSTKEPVLKAMSSPQSYLAAVEKTKEYIRSGDIIQAVISQRWAVESRQSPFEVYRALRIVNPSPYMYLLHFPELDLVGSSPELLVRKENDFAETRPIAGTRPRGANEKEDLLLAGELIEDPKNAPSISCSWTWYAMTWAACASPAA